MIAIDPQRTNIDLQPILMAGVWLEYVTAG